MLLSNTQVKNPGIYLCKYKSADRWEQVEVLASDDILIVKFAYAIFDIASEDMALFEFMPVTIKDNNRSIS